MDELIKKDGALEICDRWRRRANSVHDRDGFYIANVIYEQMKELEDARPRGEWIIEIDANNNTYGRCSICGMKQYAGQLNFCPDCGAVMKRIGRR